MVVILKVILDLAGDCNNYSRNQRSPYFEYGSYSRTQRPCYVPQGITCKTGGNQKL